MPGKIGSGGGSKWEWKTSSGKLVILDKVGQLIKIEILLSVAVTEVDIDLSSDSIFEGGKLIVERLQLWVI